jgi:hypothetical protein
MSKRVKGSNELRNFAILVIAIFAVTHSSAQFADRNELEGVVDTSYKNASSIISLGENNDCSVRAIAEAFDIAYRESRLLLKEWGREDGEGMSLYLINKGMEKDFPGMASILLQTKVYINSHQFVNDYAVDGVTYLILAENHIFVIEEGEFCQWLVKGNMDDPKKAILGYIEIKNN